MLVGNKSDRAGERCVTIEDEVYTTWIMNPPGAKGAVDAKLVPLCAERLTAETASDLKVHLQLQVPQNLQLPWFSGDNLEHTSLVFSGGHY